MSSRIDHDKVTAVVIMFNGEDVIRRTLNALYAQSYPVDQVIVVDDCSTDSSCEIVMSEYPHAQLLSTGRNRGPGAARNAGHDQASNPTVVFMDHDITLERDTLSVLVSAANQHPHYSIFVPLVAYEHSPGIIQNAGSNVHYLGFSVNSQFSGQQRSKGPADFRAVLAFGGGCYMLRQKDVPLPCRYDEAFFYTFEDTDFAINASRLKYPALLVPRATVLHRTGTTAGMSHTTERRYPGRRLALLTRNHLTIILKHYRTITLLRVMPPLIAFNSALMLYSLLRSSNRLAAFSGYAAFIRRLPSIVSFRRAMRMVPFSREQERRLSRNLTVKTSTYQGVVMSLLFAVTNRLFAAYGKWVLKIP